MHNHDGLSSYILSNAKDMHVSLLKGKLLKTLKGQTFYRWKGKWTFTLGTEHFF